MKLSELISLEFAAAVVGAFVVAFLVDVFHVSPYWLLILLPAAFLAATWRRNKARLRVFSSGLRYYHKSFTYEDGRQSWTETTRNFLYLGVTGASIQQQLRRFLEEEKGSSIQYTFLLMAQDGTAIREQIAYNKGYNFRSMTPDQNAVIDQLVGVEKDRLTATISVLQSSEAYRATPRRLEILLYDEFTPWWLTMLDEKTIFLGLLRFGEDGGDDPVAVFEKNTDQPNLFTSFQQNIERLRRSASPPPGQV